MKIYSIYDRAIESFTPPFFQPTNAGAIRSINGAMQDQNSQLHQNPTDFELYCLGDFDEQSGEITGRKERIIRLEDIVATTKE